MPNNAQPPPLSMEEWRKQARRRERAIVASTFGLVMALVVALVLVSTPGLANEVRGFVADVMAWASFYRNVLLMFAGAISIPVVGFFIVIPIWHRIEMHFRRFDDDIR